MDIPEIMRRKFPDSEWVLRGETYAGLEWISGDPKPTKAKLEELWPTLQAEIEAEEQAVIEARQSAIAKLEALGLTVGEVQAAFGLNANE